MLPKHNSQISRETLLDLGFDKLVQEFDDHEASREGLGFRELQPKVISKHFEDLGLDPDIANHNEISGLSGGQKVKVVIAGAMWNNPHLLVLDEPTNFLDRDSLGGLAVAIRDYRGGVVMISHNEEFVGALCPEQWHVANGRVTHKGHLAVSLDRFEDSRPGSSVASSAAVSLAGSRVTSASASAVNSEAEDGDMNFKAKKKRKMTKKQLKEQEVRRRLRYIEWYVHFLFGVHHQHRSTDPPQAQQPQRHPPAAEQRRRRGVEDIPSCQLGLRHTRFGFFVHNLLYPIEERVGMLRQRRALDGVGWR
jgi:elongation factor 3